MKRLSMLALLFAVLAAAVGVSLSGTPGENVVGKAAADAGQVFVSELPQGERELIGVSEAGAHVLRLSGQGKLLHWTDPAGDQAIVAAGVEFAALEVLDPKNRNKVLYPEAKSKLGDLVLDKGKIEAAIQAAEVKVVYAVEPNRLGIRVDGPAAAYPVRGRSPCRAEGARVVAPKTTMFASADLGAAVGAPQILVDGRRTLGLSLIAPQDNPVTWRISPTGGWGTPLEHVSWEVQLKPGETLWVEPGQISRHEGPVRVGLCRRRMSRPDYPPVAVATLSSAELKRDQPIELTLSQPIEKIVPGGKLVAALLPTSPSDPIEEAEHGAWFTRFDHYGDKFLGVEVRAEGDKYRLVTPASLNQGVYRLRLWLVPGDIPLPGELGGAAGVHVGYFPGFEGRANYQRQDFPIGDVLVASASPFAGSLTVLHPAQRTAFRRGEPVTLLVQARGPDKNLAAELRVFRDGDRDALTTKPLLIPIRKHFGVDELSLETRYLPEGSYRVDALAMGFAPHDYTFTIGKPLPSGMPVLHSPLHPASDVAAIASVGVTGWVDVMPPTSGFAPAWPRASATGRSLAAANFALPLAPPVRPSEFDELVRRGWVSLQGIQSRQISFGFHHTIAEHVDETLRKHLVHAQMGRRFPSTLGLVLDYDVAGTTGYDGSIPTYGKAMKHRNELLAKIWETTWEKLKADGATEADRGRLQGLFHANILKSFYADSIRQLHAALPEQRHSTAATADHAGIQSGQYLPALYAPLDFRYLECWNDQIYPNGAHEMQESFWAALLRMEQKPRQPIWLTIPTAPQPGTHFRRTLEASTYGAMGTGYNAEGAAGLTGGWGMPPNACNVRSVQEELTGTLAQKYGTWLNHFEPAEEVAILYSISQGGWNYGLQSPMFFTFYTLAQANRPARLVTEEEVAAGILKSMKALVLVRQKAKLPDATLKTIETFAANGGKVLCDSDCDPKLPGIHLKDVAWRESLWPDGGNLFHNIISGYAEKFGPILRKELGDIGRPPLDCTDGSALVACKKALGGTLVVVTNNQKFPFDELFTADQQKAKFFRWFMRVGSMYYKDGRLPHTTRLSLRPDLAAKPPRVYDVFAGKELTWQPGGKELDIDLGDLQGRVLLLTDSALAPPSVHIADRNGDDPLATLVARSPVPVPIRIRVGSQEIYRAATNAGSCDTFALGFKPGTIPIEITELATGQTQRAELTLQKSPSPSVIVLPPVQVRDAEGLRQVLKAKGLAIYVDPRQSAYLPAAQRLAKQLGNGAEVIFNPPVREYAVTWDPSPEQDKNNRQVLSERLLGWRRMTEVYGQWTGALKPSPVWNRPVLLFGTALDNRLLADLDQVTLLARPAAPELIGLGRAFVQPLAAPFWNGHDAAVILCADTDGLEKAFAELLNLVGGKGGASVALDDDGGARREQRQLVGLEPQITPKKTTALPTKPAEKSLVGLTPSLPVSAVAVVGDGVLATIHSPGRNLVRLDKEGKIVWRTASGGFSQPTDVRANSAGEAIVSDDTFVWRHGADGKVLWKALANPVASPGADGNAWVLTDEGRLLVSSAGRVIAKIESKDTILAASPDGRTIFVHRPGDPKQGRTRADSALVALRDGKIVWSVPNLLTAEVQVSRDGSIVACIEHELMAGRDDLDWLEGSRLTALDAASGKILMRKPLGESLTDLQISPDGKRLAALGHAPSPNVRFMPLTTWNGRALATRTNRFTRIVYLTDIGSNTVRRTLLPETGVWASTFAEDGKTFWAASRSLIGINTDTLAIKPGAAERFVCLAARPGGLVAGTADGSVAWIDGAGQIERQTNLIAGLASTDPKTMLAPLREAKLVEPGPVEPNPVPSEIALVHEADTYLNMRGDVAAPRGDGIVPIRVAFRIPENGRYRFTLTLTNPKEETGKLGLFTFMPDNSKTAQTKAEAKDRLIQTVDMELTRGTTLITLMPYDWKTTPLMRSLAVRKVNE